MVLRRKYSIISRRFATKIKSGTMFLKIRSCTFCAVVSQDPSTWHPPVLTHNKKYQTLLLPGRPIDFSTTLDYLISTTCFAFVLLNARTLSSTMHAVLNCIALLYLAFLMKEGTFSMCFCTSFSRPGLGWTNSA